MHNTSQRQLPNPELNAHNKQPLIRSFILYTRDNVKYLEEIAAQADPGINPALRGEQHAAQHRPVQLGSPVAKEPDPAQLHIEEVADLVADLAQERAQAELEATFADPAYQQEQATLSPTDAAAVAYNNPAATQAPATFFRPTPASMGDMNRYLN